MLHFSYRTPGEDLRQGDLLKRTPAMEELLAAIHPHYAKSDYQFFLVLTQSCDLVRRGKDRAFNARYITIAAVRPLELVIRRELEAYQNEFCRKADVCASVHKPRLKMFLERLLNNNESEFFYLHPEPALGLTDRVCAFLRLSISLRAAEHYQKCVDARFLSLSDVFQAKLGWLIGNMYSRVGTEDWVPKFASKEEFSATLDGILESACQWYDREKLKQAEAAADPTIKDRDALREIILSTIVKSKKDRVLDQVVKVLTESGVAAPPRVDVRGRLSNDPVLASLLKQ